MRTSLVTTLDAPDEFLTTGEAAKLLSSSRQHVVDLCDRGALPFTTVGVHRRVRRSDVDMLRHRTDRLTKDQRRSRWLGHAIAGKLVTDPLRVIRIAQTNLDNLRAQHIGAPRRWLDEWARLLDGPVEGVLDALTSMSPRARELRQNSPFAGVLSAEERRTVLEAFQGSRGLPFTHDR